MARVEFSKIKQSSFLDFIQKKESLTNGQIAEKCNVCERTFRDWKRDKYKMSYFALQRLCVMAGVSMPKGIKVLTEHWGVSIAGRVGGKKYMELYGSLGTLESRRRGGIVSQNMFRENRAYAEKVGFILRKKVKYPERSELLAEFIGVMIGDGSIRNDYQIAIAFNGREDQDYAVYIQYMIKKLFDVTSSIKKNDLSAEIVVSGKSLVEFLAKIGLSKGNKVVNQIRVPNWIFERKEYQTACLRGLFDTDGCVYQHNYVVENKRYKYVKMCFRNYSLPVLISFKDMLVNLGFHPVTDIRQKSVYLHTSFEVNKYFLEIGTSNLRYFNRYREFFSKKIGRIGEVA